MRIALALLSFAFVCLGSTAYSGTLDQNGYFIGSDGKLILMETHEALNACPAGTHLISAREVAEEARTFGAAGIVPALPKNCWHTEVGLGKTLIEDNRSVSFCYDNRGYKMPSAAPYENIWTSTIYYSNGQSSPTPGSPPAINPSAWTFLPQYGLLYLDLGDSKFGVRCLSN